jgi:hypothetical protein
MHYIGAYGIAWHRLKVELLHLYNRQNFGGKEKCPPANAWRACMGRCDRQNDWV